MTSQGCNACLSLSLSLSFSLSLSLSLSLSACLPAWLARRALAVATGFACGDDDDDELEIQNCLQTPASCRRRQRATLPVQYETITEVARSIQAQFGSMNLKLSNPKAYFISSKHHVSLQFGSLFLPPRFFQSAFCYLRSNVKTLAWQPWRFAIWLE
jgi:hypothetical protein